MLTEQNFKDAAKLIGCEVATIKAVAEVEGKGNGFFADKTLLMLFEPHVFWKRLKAHGIDPAEHITDNEDILYPIWGSKPYPASANIRYQQLEKACKIHQLAAFESCSWGMFQIMGFNAKKAGYNDAIDMKRLFELGELHQLTGFCRYIISASLDDELRLKAWKQFARGYNGDQYFKNKYDSKLEVAYTKYKRS